MERLEKRRRLFFTVAIASVVFGALSIAGIIFSILKLWYFPMALCIAITAHGFYGSPFYFIAYSNLGRSKIILAEIERGESDIGKIAKNAGITEEFASELLMRCRASGYIDDDSSENGKI
ncbi:MAG: hypothetical protein E7612_09905 [Ruminococcaceae bacterium]|nr:hypothetical protein [Oscillospiraceae bacterium]